VYVPPAVPSPPPDLLAADPVGLAGLTRLVNELVRAASSGLRRRSGPLPSMTPQEYAARTAAWFSDGVLPEQGRGVAALPPLARWYAEGTVDLSDPVTAAHLQPPALTVAVAADVLVNAFNASVDTWDSGPSAVELERYVVAELARLVGYGPTAGGVFTSGGTASNLHALLLARDLAQNPAVDPGLPRVVLCSTAAHFSVARACAVLGLGEDAVVTVEVDASWRMRPDALDAALRDLAGRALPVAVVATAGTTDFGSVDPLPDIVEVVRRHGVRLHVDAAYGGGALFSDRLRPLLDGVAEADSITLDLHKTAWQPAAASVLLVRDEADFALHNRRVAYLNPADDGEAGYDGLLGHSLATTRRADAFKVAATFLALGRRGLGRLMDICHDLARYAAGRIAAHPRLELTTDTPTLTTVVFRYRCDDPHRSDRVNGALRRRLMRSGTALIGRTCLPGRPGAPRADGGWTGEAEPGSVRLKLTLLNPQTRPYDIDQLLDMVVAAGDEEDR